MFLGHHLRQTYHRVPDGLKHSRDCTVIVGSVLKLQCFERGLRQRATQVDDFYPLEYSVQRVVQRSIEETHLEVCHINLTKFRL